VLCLFFFSWAVFPTFVVFCSLNSPEWLFDIALSAFKSLLLLFSFKMRLLYPLLRSLLLAIYAGKRTVYSEIARKDLLYKKQILISVYLLHDDVPP
jgi:hypothetical protein